uniref:Vesicle transport protein USE1 n=2 Tax=Lygus hesperus TaxID=30085 RepID=A0A146L0W0_LYGHE
MAKTAIGDLLSESLSFGPSQSQGDADSVLKKFFNTFLEHFLGQKRNSWSTVYQNYIASLLAFFNSRIPFQVSFLEFSLLNMSLRNGESDEKSSPKSLRELLEDSRRNNRSSDGGLDSALRYHSDKQSEISANMIQMARALKTQTLAANSIIHRDVRSLQNAKLTAEQNASALERASNKMAACSKDGMNWSLVLLVVVVLMIFINMVLFMKFMKKN